MLRAGLSIITQTFIFQRQFFLSHPPSEKCSSLRGRWQISTACLVKATKCNRMPPPSRRMPPLKAQKATKSQRIPPPQGPKCQNGSPKGQNECPEAKIKGNEGVQSQNEANQRPQAQKLENRVGHGADKFFVWDLGTTDRFWQLVGGAHGRRPEVVRDTPLKAQKAAKSKRIPP